MNNNHKLIDAVNCKFPQNNLTEIYYKIGRILPLQHKDFQMVEYQTGIEINMFKLLKLSHMGDSENTEKSMVTIFVMEKGLIVLIHRKIHGVKKTIQSQKRFHVAVAVPGSF